jgi:two-component system, cell cycle sensor histidine kinase and response regulator CckA
MRYFGWIVGLALGAIPVWSNCWAAGEADSAASGFVVPGIAFVLGALAVAVFCLLAYRSKPQGNKEPFPDRSCLEPLDQPVVLTDPDGTILYANTAFSELSGYTREELVGRGHRELECGRDAVTRVDALDPGAWRGRLLLAGKGEGVLDVHASVQTLLDEDGRVLGGLHQYRKVSGESRSEVDTRLEAVSVLAGGVARDFNNTLAVILNNAEIIQADHSKGEGTGDRVERIIKAALRARDVVKRLLAFSRQGERDARPHFLRDVLVEAEEILREAAPSTISFRFFRDDEPYPVLVDPIQIRRVLLNLCVNAVEAMENVRGAIEVGVEKADLASCLDAGCVRPISPNGYVRLTVSDVGCGIPPEVRDRMFDPFFTTKEAVWGAGLGLSEVRGIVQDHGGVVQARERVGGGTEFRVYLPLLESPAAGLSPGIFPEPVAGKRKILIVDEETEYLEAIRIRLEREGYEAHGVSAAPEALEILRRGDLGYDMIIAEQEGTAMTGLDLVERIRVRRPEIPALLCSGYGEGATDQHAALLGVSMLRKPFTLDELVETVHFMLGDQDVGSFSGGKVANAEEST